MFTSVALKGYRGFQDFQVGSLARVNLLVGTNNSGKTSILEALHLLYADGDPTVLWSSMTFRGERIEDNERLASSRRTGSELDICHILHGHDLRKDSSVCITGSGPDSKKTIQISFSDLPADEKEPVLENVDEVFSGRLVLEINSPEGKKNYRLSPRGGLSLAEIDRSLSGFRQNRAANAVFLTTEGASPEFVVNGLSRVALRPEEMIIVNALRILAPEIEGVRVVINTDRPHAAHGRGGVIVKCKDIDIPVPIGSMGEGMWRILSLAMAITRAENGVLLVDEIDTGLHYTVMEKMWKMISETAAKLNVQVFATTHSFDCVASLACICSPDANTHNVSIQRIDSRKKEATSFSEQEIIKAAEYGIEIR